MKKFRYIIAAVLVVAMGLAIFFACEKENEDYNNANNIKLQQQKEIPQIQFLSNLTGIDIIELSQKMYIEDFVNILEMHTNKLSNGIINGTIDSNYFENLEIRVNQNITNIDSLWSYYQEYSLLSYNESQLTIVTLPENEISYMCMNNQLVDLSVAINNLCNEIGNEFPEFNALNDEMKIDVIVEALCYGRCDDELEEDLNRAKYLYGLKMAVCITGGIGAAFIPFAGGALGPIAYFACATAASIELQQAIDEAYDKYYQCDDD